MDTWLKLGYSQHPAALLASVGASAMSTRPKLTQSTLPEFLCLETEWEKFVWASYKWLKILRGQQLQHLYSMYPREAEEGEKRQVNTQPYGEQETQRINVLFCWVFLSQKLQMFWSPHATPSTVDNRLDSVTQQTVKMSFQHTIFAFGFNVYGIYK